MTCFDVLHQLEDFTAAVELLLALGETRDGGPQRARRRRGRRWTIRTARSAWSAGAAEELRRLLPAGAVAARQVPVRAAAIVPDGGEVESAPLGSVDVGADQAPAHHLLAFGVGADAPRPGRAGPRCRPRRRARRRPPARESDLAYLEARLAQLEAPAASG